MAPSEFWRLHPEEFFWLLELKSPQKRYGSMTEAEVAQIYAEDFGAPEGEE